MALELTQNSRMLTYFEKHSTLINEDFIPEGFFKGNVELIEVVIPEGIKSIRTGAFDGCDSLFKITIPNSLKRIDCNVFVDTALTEIAFPDTLEEVYCWLDSKGAAKLILSHPSPDELIKNLKTGYAMNFYFEGDTREDQWD